MPKIEIAAENFYQLAGKRYSDSELENMLPAAKAELDGWDEEAGTLKIELNDTNRPDLWSAAGLARQLRSYASGEQRMYDFFSTDEESFDCENRVVKVDPKLQEIRPFIAAFSVCGKSIDDATL